MWVTGMCYVSCRIGAGCVTAVIAILGIIVIVVVVEIMGIAMIGALFMRCLDGNLMRLLLLIEYLNSNLLSIIF